MKKFLLFAALAMTAMSVDAQSLADKKVKMPALSERISKMAAQQPLTKKIKGEKASRRSFQTGVYYKRPAGLMYSCFTEEGGGYYQTYLVSNPFITPEFVPVVPKSTDFAWHMNMLGKDGVATFSEDLTNTDLCDPETGVLYYGTEFGLSYPLPTLVTAKDSFTIGHTLYNKEEGTGNRYWTDYKNYVSRLKSDTIAPHGFYDDHSGSSAFWGLLTPKVKVYNKSWQDDYTYLFGTGTCYLDDDKTLDSLATSVGAAQYFEKPQSPLYVENVFIRALSFASKPIDGDAKLKMVISNALYDKKSDSYYAGEKVIATLECSAEDVEQITDPEAIGDGQVIDFVLKFKQKKESLLGVSEEPFTIDEPFVVTITGFNQEGVDVNLYGITNPDEDELAHGSILMEYNKKLVSLEYRDAVALPLTFNSCFDYAEPWATASTTEGKQLTDFNVLLVDADGKTVSNKGMENVNYTGVSTAFSWFNEDGEENYLVLDENQEEAPEWITSISAESTYDEEDGFYDGNTFLSVECETLPQEVKGRYALLFVYGRGYTSKTPLIIVQGEVDDLDQLIATLGIENTNVKPVASTKFFNLMGQQTTKAAKGIVVHDGKKFFVK
ncbi:MAG: hypothetical protein K6D91_06215 [Prevotella sp.]|nr:hypothetical protein [Prevotella sp.]